MQTANEKRMNQIRQESEQAIRQQTAELRNQHSANMEGLRNEYLRMEADRNKQIEKLRREQTGLTQQLAVAKKQFQGLKNRPGKLIKVTIIMVYDGNFAGNCDVQTLSSFG
jgi:DNA repair exonuclease SbcCD ATPase subunit